MTLSFASLRAKAASLAGCVALLVSFSPAQKPEARILAPVSDSVRTTLTGTRPMRVQAADDAGRVPGALALSSVTISFSKTAAQQAALDALIEAQQNPASPQYHQWLSPEQYGAQFGAADADIEKVQSWLEQQGLMVNEVSRNRSQISFSGTVAQVEAAFGFEMHYYVNASGEKHRAPSTDVSIPTAFAGTILDVGNLSDFAPKPHSRPRKNFTFSNGVFALTPGDVSVIYDINAAYSAGYNGAGQSIAVIGQSEIVPSDITTFQTLVGVPVRAPIDIPVPNTNATAFDTGGDEFESDLDLEYTSSIAKGATIYFVHAGAAYNGAFAALEYIVTNKTAPIISSSYGECEIALGATNFATLNNYLQEAATQGQTVISAAGDNGSTDCYLDSNLTATQRVTLSADFPGSSQYVTAVGGTEFPAADVASGSPYWTPTTGTDVTVSAKSYIPEMVWNDDAGYTGTRYPLSIASGGGGTSVYSPRPSWQTGVTGIPSGSFRVVPDIALDASNFDAPYLVCTSDSAASGFTTPDCADGFRDSTGTNVAGGGGTSFAAPIFAGMLAIINQKIGGLYQGVINTELYKLASSATTYASAFHDIVNGSNECALNSTYLSGYTTGGTAVYGPACTATDAASYAAATGYDLASGLGSVDLFNLLTAWPNQAQLTGSSTTVTATTLTPASGAVDTITFKVASASSSVTTVPTGTINLTVDSSSPQTLTLTNGTATYAFTSTAQGSHTLIGVYTGDTNFSTSTGSITLTVAASTLKATATTLSAATTPAILGTADAITITVAGTTPASPAPTGAVTVTLDGVTQPTLTLTAGSTTSSTTYTLPATTAIGSHIITAQYGGDANYQASQTPLPSLTISVASPGSFTLSAAALAIPDGSTGSEPVIVTPVSGFSGAVNVSLSTTANIVNACYTTGSGTVSGATTIPVTIYTNSSNCPSGALALVKTGARAANEAPAQPGSQPGPPLPVGLAMAGLLAIGFAGRRSRKLRGLIAVALLAVAGFGLSGCGSGSTSGAGISTSAPKGSYTVTVSATDAATGTKTATPVTFTLTIQ